MDHFRLRKYRGPEVWARVREAYLAGEPGPQVARRFDVGLANLRKKAREEGWTRNRAAVVSDPLILATQPRRLGAEPDPEPGTAAPEAPPDPRAALDDALRAAARLVKQGRGTEAAATVRAAKALAALVAELPPVVAPLTDAEKATMAEAYWKDFQELVAEHAGQLAKQMLGDRVTMGAYMGAAALHWRAANLGPEVAAADYADACAHSTHPRHYDGTGKLLPLKEELEPAWKFHRHFFV